MTTKEKATVVVVAFALIVALTSWWALRPDGSGLQHHGGATGVCVPSASTVC